MSTLYHPMTDYLSIYYIKQAIKDYGYWRTYHDLRAQQTPRSKALWALWIAYNSKR